MVDWRSLLANRGLLDAAAACERFDEPAAVARLRRFGDAATVAAAIDLVSARRKAAGKLDRAGELLLDTVGVEQATSTAVADHKARRFADAAIATIADLGCGIGGDAMGLAQIAAVQLIDLAHKRVTAARHNVQTATGHRPPAAVADATTLNLAGRAVHLDPSRRDADRRRHRYADYQPGPDFIERLVSDSPAAAIKLGPGVDFNALPAGEIELISEHGRCVQAVLWTGSLARHARSATALPAGESLAGTPGPPPIGPVDRYLMTADPAAERAGLLNVLCESRGLAAVHPAVGLLTGPEPIADAWCTPFEVLATMPWRPRRVKAWLDAHHAGIVEVKTRAKAVDPDRIAADLRGVGDRPFTVFVHRYDQQRTAHITRRL